MATATAPRPRVDKSVRRRQRRPSCNPRILGIGTANPAPRFTQKEAYRLAGYDSQRILEIFLNSDIDTRHFYVDLEHINRHETPDELNQRYLCGAMEIGAKAIVNCLEAACLNVHDVDLLVTCTCTGYVCPDVGTRLIAQMGFRRDVERAPMMGLGCAGALPTLQRASDYARAYPGRKALMLAVEICSAAYFIDNTLETVVGNAICADGAAAFLLSAPASSECDSGPEMQEAPARLPQVVDFESFIDPGQLDKVGFEQRDGKLRIILAALIRDLAAPMIAQSLDPLLERNGLARSDIRFWVAHPGGRKVIDNVQREMGLTDEQLRHSKKVMRSYGNMSSPTVMFVLDEVARHGDPRPGDWGVMIALGPGMAAETALLRW
jgi:3,5-dihydroxyphenylacetyl-CoA synthase